MVSIQPRTSLLKFAKNEPKVRITLRKNIGGAGWGVHEFCRALVPAQGCALVSYGLASDARKDRRL